MGMSGIAREVAVEHLLCMRCSDTIHREDDLDTKRHKNRSKHKRNEVAHMGVVATHQLRNVALSFV